MARLILCLCLTASFGMTATDARAAETPSQPAMADGRTAGAEFVTTPASEVLLDGRPIRYEDVPETAVIIRLQVAPDRRTIVRIHFRSA